jgi:hypothetical protein
MNALQQLKAVFVPPSAEVLAVQELEEAKRQLLAALTAQEHYTAAVAFRTTQVARLTKHVKEIAA